MKTIVRVFYAFVLTALLAACSAAPTATTPPTEAATAAPTETVAPTATTMPSSTDRPTAAAAAFDIRAAQYVLDTAGFHGIAETLTEKKVIEASYLSTTNRVKKVLAHTTWPTELDAQAQAFITTLTEFATALEADKVDEAVKLGEPVHDAQHDLSHAIDEWAATAKAGTADPFDVSVAQYLLDNAGFHGIAETLAEKKVIESSYLSTTNRIKKVVMLTAWPIALNEKSQAFITALTDFAAALEADKVDDAIKLGETVHDTQHDLSHDIDEWLASAKPVSTESDTFNVHIAQYFLDTAGFHGIAETLAETKKIETTYLSKVNRVKKVLMQTVWPAALNEEAQAFIKTLGEFAAALEADKVDEAIKLGTTVHDAQHDLSHAIDGPEEDEKKH